MTPETAEQELKKIFSGPGGEQAQLIMDNLIQLTEELVSRGDVTNPEPSCVLKGSLDGIVRYVQELAEASAITPLPTHHVVFTREGPKIVAYYR